MEEPEVGHISRRWKQFCAGDIDAFTEIAEFFYAPLDHYCTRFTSDQDLIKDCLQDLFLDIWEKRGNLDHINSIKPYLFLSVRNNLIKRIRKNRLLSGIRDDDNGFDDFVSPESTFISNETDQLNLSKLAHAMDLLPARQKEALYLRYYNNLSYEEIGKVMGLQRQAVANYLQYGIQKLREHWSQTVILLFLLLF